MKIQDWKEKSYLKFLGGVRNRFNVREFRSWSLSEIGIRIRIRVRIRQGVEQILGAKFYKLLCLLTKWKIYDPIQMIQFKYFSSIPILLFNDPIEPNRPVTYQNLWMSNKLKTTSFTNLTL